MKEMISCSVLFSFSFLSLVLHQCLGDEASLTSQLASAICGQVDSYEETKEIQPSLKRLPGDIPLLSDCDTWLWNKCSKKGDKKCGTIEHTQCSSLKKRVLGGTVAGVAEFPWDVAIRFIYDWGSFFPEPRPAEDIARNDFKGLKESHRCTGTLYSSKYVLTSAWCGHKAKEYIATYNRFVIWIARGRFLDAKNIEAFPGKPMKGNIFVHPEFNAEVGLNNHKDYDIAVLEMPSKFKFSDEVHAIKIAPETLDFTGKRAVFSGWGTTNANLTGTQLSAPGMRPAFGNKLFKLELTIIEFKGTCEEVVRGYLELSDEYNPEEDVSKRYLCAKADNPEAQGACGGDIGGPLICPDGDKKVLCGLKNSWNMVAQCPTKDNIEIFVRPSFFLPFIEKVAGKQDPKETKQS